MYFKNAPNDYWGTAPVRFVPFSSFFCANIYDFGEKENLLAILVFIVEEFALNGRKSLSGKEKVVE
jgi:hypothetical protein